MPQMAPISWLSLFIMFFISFMMFCMMNYYMMLPNSPKIYQHYKTTLTTNYNWKW